MGEAPASPELLDPLSVLVAGTPLDLDAAYRYCARVARARARNFAWGFLLLPAAKKRGMVAAYAFSRVCDDIVDEPRAREDKIRLLAEVRRELDRCLDRPSACPIFLALADTARRFGIPIPLFHELVDGVEMDLDVRRYETFADLHPYCYRVASVVGLISMAIFGTSDADRARPGAVDLGLAMQLTNILRDVREDLEAGRIYLPRDEMSRFGVGEDDLRLGRMTDGVRALFAFQAARAREHFARGRALLPYVDADARFCPSVLQGIYERLLDRIEKRGFDVFSGRVRVPTLHKLAIVARCALGRAGEAR